MLSSPFIIPIVAIIGGLSVGAFSRWLKHQERMHETASQDQGVSEEIALLKERVAALETIATDSRERLRQEIESL